jgi:cytochrome b pre-mRNA-processing protein 3
MLRFLFPRLTRSPAADLFITISEEARAPHWYVDGQVPDTIDGRFAMLATILGLVLVRLERDSGTGDGLSVALTERFIDVMESEHREIGLGDPKLGRTVRKLVGSLSRRTDLWRSTMSGERAWKDSVSDSVYKSAPAAEALSHTSEHLRLFWTKLEAADIADLAEGKLS